MKRTFLLLIPWVAVVARWYAVHYTSVIGMPAMAQGPTKMRIGNLHTLAVDGQMWLADHLKSYATHGIEPEFRQFQTGLELFQAMIGGSVACSAAHRA